MGPDNQKDPNGKKMSWSEPKMGSRAQGRVLCCQEHRLSEMWGGLRRQQRGIPGATSLPSRP